MERRLAILQVSPDFIMELCRRDFKFEGIITVEHGLPMDAVCLYSYQDGMYGAVNFVLYSNEFNVVPVDRGIPHLPPPTHVSKPSNAV